MHINFPINCCSTNSDATDPKSCTDFIYSDSVLSTSVPPRSTHIYGGGTTKRTSTLPVNEEATSDTNENSQNNMHSASSGPVNWLEILVLLVFLLAAVAICNIVIWLWKNKMHQTCRRPRDYRPTPQRPPEAAVINITPQTQNETTA